ncbi:hypothetical protein EVAR_22207_1 [Eumeta japonica]|uniref:Integrase zinc-binding domain-containing protein n=1 Tax=Eumeta variegata TaxID=151549 RepID=A0A4C1UAK8_EUMVA|nr:hypothetical protein EVAR_22207_1 [Eumeta japonica]
MRIVYRVGRHRAGRRGRGPDDAGLERPAYVNFILAAGGARATGVMRGHKVVIPSNLREAILDEVHSSHFGTVKMKASIRTRLWFLGVEAALEQRAAVRLVRAQLRSAVAAPP